MSTLNTQLDKIASHFDELEVQMAQPEIVSDYNKFNQLAQERTEIEKVVETYRLYRGVQAEIADNRELIQGDDPEIRELAELEIESLTEKEASLENELKLLLVPKDPQDEKDVIIEVRAGAGGDEAGLFAAELLRMYTRWAENHKFKVELLSMHETGVGGVKEAFMAIRGKGAYSQLKFETGVHRVQRVPTTESQGRIHTSAATVAVLPEADEVEIVVNENDIRIDVFRSSGPGGQSVNTTDSAVRLTHIPTGLVISCQDEKSQLQNRIKAMRILRTRLYELEEERRRKDENELRNFGTGDRSEKIRTYNFPQSRITDHRINKTVYQLDAVLDGYIDEFIQDLSSHEQAERLQSVGE